MNSGSNSRCSGAREVCPMALCAVPVSCFWQHRVCHSAIATQLGVSNPTVAQWCKRFIANGIDGLYDQLSGGRPRTYDDDEEAHLMQRALDERPADGRHWSVRSFAEASGVSKSTVHRYSKMFGVQPYRRRTFKLSTDPFFVEKVRDIVGLYLNPSDHALVLCGREKPGAGAGAQSARAAHGVGIRRGGHP